MHLPQLWPKEVEERIQAEAYSLDTQPRVSDPVMCKRCVMTSARPRITFDAEGICSACRYVERRVDWADRLLGLEQLRARYRRGHGYDIIVPCSGGKDSSAVAWRLKNEFGMNPLCVKWAPFIETEIGRRNLQSLVHHGFDIIEMMPNGLLHRRLARLAFEFLGDHFQPFIYGQLAYPLHMALKFDISLVFGAENGEATYGGDTAANEKSCWDYDDWERIYLKGAGVEKLMEIGRKLGAFSDDDMRRLSAFYSIPDHYELAARGIQYHWLAHYLPHHPQGNYYFAAERTGFAVNEERNCGTFSRYASIDDETDDFHYYMAYVKFGIGRCTSDAAHEIRDGDLTREEGLALVARYDGEFPSKQKHELFMDYLGLNDGHFWRVVERFKGPHVKIPANRAA